MTQQEFTNLTGRKVDVCYFALIHDEYMNSPLDKREFCKKWVKNHPQRDTDNINALLESFQKRIQDLVDENEWLKNRHEGYREEIRRMTRDFRSNYNFMNGTIRSLKGAVAQG